MGEKTAKSKDCFFKSEARRLLKTKADDKMRPKTKLRNKETGKMPDFQRPRFGPSRLQAGWFPAFGQHGSRAT
jgi:hypothetical protein